GVAGLTIGWRLRQAGADVLVLERAQAGQGATWAAAGMIAATTEMSDAHAAEADLGLRARALWAALSRGVQAPSRGAGDYRQSGAVLVARTAAEAASFDARAAADPDLRTLTPDAARAMEPMLGAMDAALWDCREAQVDNRALGRALTAAFVHAGGTLS